MLTCRSGNLLAYSSFDDITLLKVARGERKDNKNKKMSEQIVLIEKDEIINLFERVKEL